MTALGSLWAGGDLGVTVNAHLQWAGSQFIAAVDASSVRFLELAAIHTLNEMKRVVGVPNPTGATPSLPGEPPRKVSGDLQRGLNYIVDRRRKQFMITVNPPADEYSLLLEYGTRKMAPRPYIRTTLARVAPALAARIGRPGSHLRTSVNFDVF